MADLIAKPLPGQDVVVVAPTGTKLGSKVTYNAAHDRVRVKNTGVWVEPTPPPVVGPKVLSVTVEPTTNGATVRWTLDQPCTGQVLFGPTPAYGSATFAETSFAYTSHAQTISGLLPGTTSHFAVAGENAAGQLYSSPDATFTTLAIVTPPPPPPPPVVTPGTYPIPRTLIAVPLNNDPKPSMGQVITDSVTGTKIRRISPDGNQNQYSKHQAWSKDAGLIYLQRGNIYDVRTNTFLGAIASGGEFPIWSNIEPATMYGVLNGYGPKFGRWTRATGWQTYHDFAAEGFSWLAVGNYEGTVSRDDKAHILAKRSDGSQWMFVYDIANNRVGPGIPRAHPDGSAISQSGKYVVLNYDGTGTGMTNGAWLLRDDMSVVRQMASGGNVGAHLGHQDFGWAQDGSEVLVFVGNGVVAQRLDNGTEYQIAGGIFGAGHVSCANYDRPGYAYLSSNSYFTGSYGVNQAVAVKIAPIANPPVGEVFASTHAENPATHQIYDYAPHVSASRDGTKVIWGSVWSNTSTGPMSAYIGGVTV